VAVLVAVLGTPSPADLPGSFDDAWTLMVAAAVGSIAAFAAVGPPARPQASVEAEIESAIASLAPEVAA
jgi:hypothetical protein